MKRVAITLSVVLALAVPGCAHKQLTSRQLAIGATAVVFVGLVIYLAANGHCANDNCNY